MARTASNLHNVRLLKSVSVPAALQANALCGAGVTATLPNIPVAGGLTFVYQPRFAASAPMDPGAGTTWNKYWVDEREGVISWCDGDHGEPTGVAKSVILDANRYANGVRYFNYVGPDSFHGVAPGEDKYILPSRDTYRSGQTRGTSSNPLDGNYWFTTSRQLQAASVTRPPQFVGYKTMSPISGGVVRIWDGTASNKVNLLYEIPDGTPAANWPGMEPGDMLNQPDATCKVVPYLPKPGNIPCPNGLYIEFIPNDPAQPFIGGVAVRQDHSRPAATPPAYAPISDYDNYHWWYSKRDKKFFWINDTGTTPDGRDGIYDMVLNRWTHGNSGINRSEWLDGPYWTDYVDMTQTPTRTTVVKNCPNAYSEALERWVLHNGLQLVIMERNPRYPADSPKPYRLMVHTIPTTHGFRYTSTVHNQSMNSGECIGEWLYFIKPMTNSQVAARFGFSSDTEFTFREFWRVRMVPPYDEFQELAPFPYWKQVVPHNGNGGSPLLSRDEPSNSLVVIGERLAVYDIETDSWSDYSPVNWEACSFHTGGFIRSRREIIHKGGSVSGSNSNESWWYREIITGGVKPRARWVPMEMDRLYEDGITNTQTQIPWAGGKHWRFVATDKFRNRADQLVREDRVFQVGGDYGTAVPSTNSQVAGYPFTVSYATYSAMGLFASRSDTDYTPDADDVIFAYTALTDITQDIVFRETTTRNPAAAAAYTIPAGTSNGTTVTIPLDSIPRAAVGLFPHFTAQQRVSVRWGKRLTSTRTTSGTVGLSGDYVDSYVVTEVPSHDILIRDAAAVGEGSVIATIPAGSAVGFTVALPEPVQANTRIFVEFGGTGGLTTRYFANFTTVLPRSRRAVDSATGYMGYIVTESPTEGIEFYNAGTAGPAVGQAPLFTIPAGAAVGLTTINELSPTRQRFTSGLYIKYLGGDGAVRLARDGSWASDSGRQDEYCCPVAEVNGKVQVSLWMNQVAFYPWPGGPDPTTTPLGPNHPDGCILFFDRDGYMWVGPYFRFGIATLPNSTAEPSSSMYRVRVPDKYTAEVKAARGFTSNAPDIAMGDTWEKVPQSGGPSSFGALFGGSNCWGTYDEVENNGLMLTTSDPRSVRLWKFPCTPATDGFHRWTQTTVSMNLGQWETFANSLCRRYRDIESAWTMPMNAPLGGFSGDTMTGPQVVVGDYIYAVVLNRTSGSFYRDNNICYLLRVHLRNPSDYAYIPLPQDIDPETGMLKAFWHRNYDALPVPGRESTAYQSINEYREVQAMGHLIVFGPPAAMMELDDLFCYWYDTNNGKWTLGPTYREMMLTNDALPKYFFDSGEDVWRDGPRTTKGNMVTVRKTGELWVPTSGTQAIGGATSRGMIKLRIW